MSNNVKKGANIFNGASRTPTAKPCTVHATATNKSFIIIALKLRTSLLNPCVLVITVRNVESLLIEQYIPSILNTNGCRNGNVQTPKYRGTYVEKNKNSQNLFHSCWESVKRFQLSIFYRSR